MVVYYFLFAKEVQVIWESRKLLSKVILISTLIIGYLTVSQIITASISKAVDREVSKFPVGFNLYVGLNRESGGVWNEKDSQMMSKLIETPGIKPQEVHNEFIKLSFDRFKSKTLRDNIALIIKKNSTMWLVDYDIIHYVKAGLDYNKLSLLDFAKYENLLVKACNLYYYIIILLCLAGTAINMWGIIDNRIMFFILVILGIVFLHFFIEVAGRYHFPVMSLLALLVSYYMTNSHAQYFYLNKNRLSVINERGLKV